MKETLAYQLGNQVRALRKKHEMTQEELAGRSGISLKYIQRIEGKDPPNLGIEALGSIAEGFDIPIWKLLKFE